MEQPLFYSKILNWGLRFLLRRQGDAAEWILKDVIGEQALLMRR